MRVAQASANWSSFTENVTTSFTMKRGELGDSEGARRRMEMVWGVSEVVRLNKWLRGFSIGVRDGIA